MRTATTITALLTTGIMGAAVGDAGVDFRTDAWLSSRPVLNGQGEEIAKVSDMILDRGEGRITHLVVTTGRILGMGGRDVAIPFGAFTWNANADSLVVDATLEELKTFPEFSASTWAAMLESDDAKSDLRRNLASDTGAAGDPYAGSLQSAESVEVKGVVKSVERTQSSTFGDQTVLTIRTDDGQSRTVSIGPSWYVSGGDFVPMRGDTVEIKARQLPRDPNRMAVAYELQSGDRHLRLRDRDGAPAWSLPVIPLEGRQYQSPYWRYMLGSSLRGSKVSCRGETCGKVENAIVERRSGDIAFLSIDPDKAFLGIGDTSRLIPWSVVSVAHNGMLRIDASKEMVLASKPTPSNLSELSSDVSSSVYSAYEVREPRFRPVTPRTPRGVVAGDAWSARGAIIAAVEKDSVRTISGKVKSESEVTLDQDVPPARAIVVEGSQGEETVLLGPSSYMSKQSAVCKPGELVTIEVIRTRINGQSHWLARSFEVDGTRVELLDRSGRPTWDRR